MQTKKIALATGLLLATVTPIISVISCGSQKALPGVYLSLDGHDHTHKDKSFNEQCFDGISDYLTFLNQENKNVLNQKEVYYKRPSATSENGFKSLYAAIPKGSTIVAPGFQQEDALKKSIEELQDKKVIYLDGSINGKSNITSVNFKIEEAAYLGGYALAKYASQEEGYNNLRQANGTASDNSEIVQISSYIGTAITPVLGFINGLQYGINDALEAIASDPAYPYANKVEFTILDNPANHQSGTYESGGGVVATNNLKNAGVDVIMPVAGPQTTDTLNNFSGKIIGVDTKQEDKFINNKEQFLFSVVKDLQTATVDLLKKLNGETDVPDFYKGLGETTTGNLENGLISISDNTLGITTIYNQIKTDSNILARAQAVLPNNEGWLLSWDKDWYTSL